MEAEKRRIRRRGVGADGQTAKRKKMGKTDVLYWEPTGGTLGQRGRWRAKVSDVSFNLKNTPKNILHTFV